jgi:integrase
LTGRNGTNRVPRAKRSPTPRRRTRGEGTLYEKTRTWKTSDGKTRSKKMWVAAISEGHVTERGHTRRRRRFFYGKTAEEVRTARNRYLNESGKELPQEPHASTTVAQYASRFIHHSEAHTRATTARSYEQVLRLHIVPHIGQVAITQLSSDRVKTLYDSLKTKVSSSMLARVHVVLRAMLNLAIEERIIAASPLASIRKAAPRHKRPRIESLSALQAKTLLRTAKGQRLEALFVLAITTGMRQGELFALRWSDIDLAKRTLSIARSAQEVDGEITFVEPKTDSSRRRVALSKVAIDALKNRRTIAAKEAHKSELAFPSERGYPLRKSNFIRRIWAPLKEAAQVSVRFHDLRHTAASLLLIEGTNPKVVQEMLGHSSVRLTLDTYSHLIPTMQAGAADAFDRVLGPRATGPREKR